MDAAAPSPPRKRQRQEPSPTSSDPIEIAMEAEAGDRAPDSPARRVLIKQEKLIEADLQHRRWQIASERFGAALKAGTGLLGLAVVLAVGAMIWTASRADGVVVEAFSVPPALAQRGVTGEALARELLDKLSAMSATSQSAEEQRGLSGDWGASLSLQIPQTGISLAQLDQWLRQKFGHESHVSAELMQDADGQLRLGARSGSTGFPMLTGPETTIDGMIQKTAEAVYGLEQPRSYTAWLLSQRRFDDAKVLYKARSLSGSPFDRAYAYNSLGNLQNRLEGDGVAEANYKRAIELAPTFAAPYQNLATSEALLGQQEAAYRDFRSALPLLARQKGIVHEAIEFQRNATLAQMDTLAGDASEARRLSVLGVGQRMLGSTGVNLSVLNVARADAALHDIASADRGVADYEPPTPNAVNTRLTVALTARSAAEDWPGVIAAADALTEAYRVNRVDQGRLRPFAPAQKAVALAHLGRMDEAWALIGATALDCQPCVIGRGQIAALAGDQRGADHWFAEAVRMAPSLPQANAAWGQALLQRGQPDQAIERFAAAHHQSPNFADPIVWWGEALAAKGDAKGAAAKFTAAQKLTPHWGRLHLKWGEALAKLGKPAEAKAQFTAAAGLDLTTPERAELQALTQKRPG